MSFPNDFHWGAASASYQIEGAVNEDGRGMSIWDAMTHRSGKIYRGHTGDIACDHYHRYQEDVALMKQIGLRAYRFSVSWSRILPQGVGTINPKGVDFYDRLIDELLAANIQPYVTLFHWDYPQELYYRGGWLNSDSPKWFADYTRVVIEALSDRVKYWITLNEPQVFIGMGHLTGEHAPGLKLSIPEIIRISHHVLLAHGQSVQTIRAYAKQPPQVGAAPVGVCFAPLTNTPQDIEAARRVTFDVAPDNVWSTSLYCDPMFLGHYPDAAIRHFGKILSQFPDSDMDTIKQPLDFFGCNIYHTFGYVQASEHEKDGFKIISGGDLMPGYPSTTMEWPLMPDALYWGPRFFYERYGKPIIVTENGLASMDWITLDGIVPDYQRIDYLSRYLMSLRHAIQDGIDIRGYMHWSIMDNFEWAEGYRPRLGLIYIDYHTLERKLKVSANWYKDVIATNGANLPTGNDYLFKV